MSLSDQVGPNAPPQRTIPWPMTPHRLFGVVTFKAAYLPWVLLGFSLMFGQTVVVNLLGLGVGHLYFFLVDVWPSLADSRGWSTKRVVWTPRIL